MCCSLVGKGDQSGGSVKEELKGKGKEREKGKKKGVRIARRESSR